MNKQELIEKINAVCSHSAWDKGVKQYALDMLQDIDPEKDVTEDVLLSGADNWRSYSEGGFALCYDSDIAARLCTTYEYRRKREGALPPNSRESWLDVQTRALYQACGLIMRINKE